MKKIAFIAALAFCLGLIGCGETSNESSKTEKENTAASETTTTTTVTTTVTTESTTTEKKSIEIKAVNEEQIKVDLQNNCDLVNKANLTVNSVTIDKRRTEGVIYITADFTGPMCSGTLSGWANYIKSNDSWVYDKFAVENATSSPTIIPTKENCQYIYEELIKPNLQTEISETIIGENLEGQNDSYIWELDRSVVTETEVDGNRTQYNYYHTAQIWIQWQKDECLWLISIFDDYSERETTYLGVYDCTDCYQSPDLINLWKTEI